VNSSFELFEPRVVLGNYSVFASRKFPRRVSSDLKPPCSCIAAEFAPEIFHLDFVPLFIIKMLFALGGREEKLETPAKSVHLILTTA